MKRWIKSSTYIKGMAIDRSKLITRMEAWDQEIVEHLAKCAMYGETLGYGKYNHWIEDELATWLSDTNDAICKHNKGKLKPKQYESILFASLGDSRVDARINLHELQRYNKKKTNSYPEVPVDDKMVERMYLISERVKEEFVPLLASINNLSKEDIEEKLHSIIDPICKSQ